METEVDALATPEVLRELLSVDPPKDLYTKVMIRINKFTKSREYESHRDVKKTKENRSTWRRENAQRCREMYIKRAFGISLEEYDTRLNKQNNKCALCGTEFYGSGNSSGRPTLDHNHDSGALREFLHSKCNAALGLFYDDPTICRMAAAYLEKHLGD
jgi:hypothetical protein